MHYEIVLREYILYIYLQFHVHVHVIAESHRKLW
jgi:hypothetical protein